MSEKCVHEWYYRIVDIVSWQFFCIRCGEKLSMDKFSNHASDLEKNADALNARIAELEAAQRWIPVGERLPENENDQVLIRRGNVVALGWIYFDELMGDWDYRCYDEDWDGNPTHWMPLPKLPEAK